MQFRLYLIFAKLDNFAIDYSVYTRVQGNSPWLLESRMREQLGFVNLTLTFMYKFKAIDVSRNDGLKAWANRNQLKM